MRTVIIVVSMVLFLAVAVRLGVAVWLSLDGVNISAHGWIAMGLTVIVSIGMWAGLMFLVFYSNRMGYDDIDQRDGVDPLDGAESNSHRDPASAPPSSGPSPGTGKSPTDSSPEQQEPTDEGHDPRRSS